MPDIPESFISLIREMREAQRIYFRLRDSRSLAHAKELEKKVDQKIMELKNRDSQLGLF